MVCGTASDVGKSQLVAGLCRVLARRGVSVAPFKGQNMSLNSAVTDGGEEIARAQVAQAAAAGVAPEVAMNPVLLKPTGERTSQVVVMGRPWATLDAVSFQRSKSLLLPVVLDALRDLRERFDVVLCEGAGSPAEPNLQEGDLVNLGLARQAGLPAVLVGDIDRGGVFAHLYGTLALLPDDLRGCVRGFVVNKFRGDRSLLAGATEQLASRSGVPTLGVLPWLPGLWVDAEDSLSLSAPRVPHHAGAGPAGGDVLDVAVVRFPRMANFTDLDPLAHEPGVAVRWVGSAAQLGRPDLVILPGTKATVADLCWLRSVGLDAAMARVAGTVLGICGGYQMLGQWIEDPGQVESDRRRVEGLGLLDLHTRFTSHKVLRRRRGTVARGGQAVEGYQIHHGVVVPGCSAEPWFVLDGEAEGVVGGAGGIVGTSLHGLFESDGFRAAFLAQVARRTGRRFAAASVPYEAARQAQIDRMADACESELDLEALWGVLEEAAR
jgi:adenosylcobyric acid synthase